MPISYIGQATGTTSATLPTHQAGDLIIGFAFRDGSNTAPSLPAGWTNIRSDGLNTCSGRLAYKIAASSSETSGTWTSATSVVFLVYRGAAIGANGSNTASSTTVNYPALTLNVTSGSSWIVGFAGHRSVDTNLQNAPTGMTNRATSVDATDEVAGHDTNGGVSSWSSTNVSAGGTASGYRSYVLEITSTDQSLTQSTTFTNTNTFYTGTVTQITSVQAPLFTNTNTFYNHIVIPDQLVVATTFVNVSEFGYTWIRRDEPSDAVIYNNSRKFDTGLKWGSFDQTLVPPLLVNTNVFYGGTVEAAGIRAPSFINQNTFYNHTVSPGTVTVAQSTTFTNTNTFYSHTIIPDQVIVSGAFVNTNVFYPGFLKGRNQILQTSTLLNTPTFHRVFVQKAVFNQDNSETGLPYIENTSSYSSPFGQTTGENDDDVYIEN